jgi:hypothetical protein
MRQRFTIDGSQELEDQLKRVCGHAQRGVTEQIPRKEIAAVVLGGGYGRGEGGVLRTETGDRPYNDLEIYVFLRGNRIWQEHRYSKRLHDLSERLSVEAGIQVEFKIDSIDRWRETPVSMFSYDLVAGHRLILGDDSVFENCDHHLKPAAIPLSEGTRLVFNRCSGLLLARQLLDKRSWTGEDADFIGRNLAKMQLALGDAVLTAYGHYHWSARQRCRRLTELTAAESLPWFAEVRADHIAGLEFKLHPQRARGAVEESKLEHRRLTELALQVWLWIENLRLKQSFQSASDYAMSAVDKCPETPAWRNYLLSVRTFGPKAFIEALSLRYPRERLFNALSLLLWDPEGTAHPRILRRLQRELQSDAPDWEGLVSVFKKIWPGYG